jgi:hypothetical protein
MKLNFFGIEDDKRNQELAELWNSKKKHIRYSKTNRIKEAENEMKTKLMKEILGTQ